jgi:hypothetical protein
MFRKWHRITLCVICFLSIPAVTTADSNAAWPRVIKTEYGILTIYQPQPESFDANVLKSGYAAGETFHPCGSPYPAAGQAAGASSTAFIQTFATASEPDTTNGTSDQPTVRPEQPCVRPSLPGCPSPPTWCKSLNATSPDGFGSAIVQPHEGEMMRLAGNTQSRYGMILDISHRRDRLSVDVIEGSRANKATVASQKTESIRDLNGRRGHTLHNVREGYLVFPSSHCLHMALLGIQARSKEETRSDLRLVDNMFTHPVLYWVFKELMPGNETET